jgi:hypothetical protein
VRSGHTLRACGVRLSGPLSSCLFHAPPCRGGTPKSNFSQPYSHLPALSAGFFSRPVTPAASLLPRSTVTVHPWPKNVHSNNIIKGLHLPNHLRTRLFLSLPWLWPYHITPNCKSGFTLPSPTPLTDLDSRTVQYLLCCSQVELDSALTNPISTTEVITQIS